MFSVEINQMIEECGRVEQQYREYCLFCSELETAVKILDSMASARYITDAMRREMDNMEEQQRALRQMAQGLERVALCYRDYEKRICDSAEQGVISFPVEDVRITELGNVRDMLNKIIF